MANWKDCCKSYGPPRIEAMVSDSPAPDVERITRPASTLARLHAFRGRSTYRLATVAFRVRALRRDFSALLGNEGLRYRRANWLGSRVASILAPTRCHLRGSATRSDERWDTVVEHRRWLYERKSGTARSRQKNPGASDGGSPGYTRGLETQGSDWHALAAGICRTPNWLSTARIHAIGLSSRSIFVERTSFPQAENTFPRKSVRNGTEFFANAMKSGLKRVRLPKCV